MSKLPKWAIPERQNYLVDLFLRSQGFCVYGEHPCQCPDKHHYEPFIDELIKDWIADDRLQAQAEWRLEQRQLHNLNERRYTKRGQWSAIGKDIFYGNQPQFYVLGYGVSGLTLKAFVKARLSSSWVCLYVDLSEAVKGMSKSQKRKAIRYGKGGAVETINKAIGMAVRDYLK